MHLTRAIAYTSLLGALFTSAGCSQVDEDTPLTEVRQDSDQEEARQAAREANAGVFTDGETDCILDALFARPGITAGQVIDYAKTPTDTGPVAEAYDEIVPPCIDRGATVEPRPLSPQVRESYIAGIKSGDPSITEEQAGCLLDAVLAAGLTPRDLALSGYDDQLFTEKVDPLLGPAGEKCLG